MLTAPLAPTGLQVSFRHIGRTRAGIAPHRSSQTTIPPQPSNEPRLAYPQPLQVVGEPYDYGLPDSTYVRVQTAAASAGE